jgi:hypothetical protein
MYSIADFFNAAATKACSAVQAVLHARLSPKRWVGVGLVFAYFGIVGVVLIASLFR